MTSMTKIVFFGTEDFSALTLQRLIDDGYEIEAVVTKPDFKRGRGKKLQQPIVKKIAQANNILIIQPQKSSELAEALAKLDKKIGVLVSYGKIIPENIINLFKHGIVNVHPSLLPKYRGPAPIETAIENGDKQTGVSIMALVKDMDAGGVYVAETVMLNGSEDARFLYDKLGRIGANLISQSLPDILNGSLSPISQDNAEATFTKLAKKADGLIDPAVKSAEEIERQIRAQIIYPKSFIDLPTGRVIIKSAHVADNKENVLSIKTVDGNYLAIDSLLNKNGNLVTANDYLNSLKSVS